MTLVQEFFIADVQDDGKIIIYGIAKSPATALKRRQQLIATVPNLRILRKDKDGKYTDVTGGAAEQ